MTATSSGPFDTDPFCHEALFYAGWNEFLRGTTRFISDGMSSGEPTLVVVSASKIEALRSSLGDHHENVMFADMAQVGANPGLIIPAWMEFVDGHGGGGRPMRGIGEPVWAGRGGADLVECQRHESLLNLAMADATGFKLLCPYDVAVLDPKVLAEAERSHPYVREGAARRHSGTYRESAPGATLEAPLDRVPAHAQQVDFDAPSLHRVRSVAGREAARAGLLSARVADFVLAVNELATNSVRHGGGGGTARIWHGSGTVTCDVSDAGRIASPLVDRLRPSSDVRAPRGLWLVNQLCDLVQLRSSALGTTVRVHVGRAVS